MVTRKAGVALLASALVPVAVLTLFGLRTTCDGVGCVPRTELAPVLGWGALGLAAALLVAGLVVAHLAPGPLRPTARDTRAGYLGLFAVCLSLGLASIVLALSDPATTRPLSNGGPAGAGLLVPLALLALCAVLAAAGVVAMAYRGGLAMLR